MQKSQLVEQQSEKLLTRQGVSLRWECCVETIKRKERAGVLKPIRFNSRMIRYRLSDIIAVETAGGAE
jgi:hypothetical protein